MKKKISLFSIGILVTGVLLTACSSSNEASQATDTAMYDTGAGMVAENEAAPQAAAAVEAEYYAGDDIYNEYSETAEAPAEAGGGAPPINDLSLRKLIRTANMTVETENFEGLLAAIEEKTVYLGGYTENFSSSKNSGYYGGEENRYASMTIRIPSDRYHQFVSEVAEVSNVLERNEGVQDVTLEYVDLESHKKVLQAEQERLLQLLEGAESMEEIIAIETRLSDIRYQLESMESQLRLFDNLVDYSTVYINVNEVKRLTPVQEQSVGEKISTGFVRSLDNLGTGLMNLFIFLIVSLPYLLVLGVIAAAIVLPIRIAARKKDGRTPQKGKKSVKNKKNLPPGTEIPAGHPTEEHTAPQQDRSQE